MIRLNLLPPEIKNELEYARKNAKIYQNLLRLFAIFFATIALMGFVYLVVLDNFTLAKRSQQSAQFQNSRLDGTKVLATDIYNRINLIGKLRKDRLNWEYIFSEIANSTPIGVRLIGFDFTNVAKNRGELVGFALSNADVGSFRELLSKSNIFQYVDIEDLSAGTDPLDSVRPGVTFKISLNLNISEAKE